MKLHINNRILWSLLACAMVSSQGLEAGFFRRIGHAIAPNLVRSNTAYKQANLKAAQQKLAAARTALSAAHGAAHAGALAEIAKHEAAVAHHSNALANHYAGKIMQHAQQYAKTNVATDLKKKNAHMDSMRDFSQKLAALSKDHRKMIRKSKSSPEGKKSALLNLRNQQNERLKTLQGLEGSHDTILRTHKQLRDETHAAANVE